MSARILYLVYREGLSSVLLSQTAFVLSRVAAAGCDARLGIFTPLGEYFRPALRREWRAVRATMEQTIGRRLDRLPSPPSRIPGCWNEALVLSAWLRWRSARRQPMILQCRNARMTSLALRAAAGYARPRIIYDCRGL
jgi:hypothetical protein